jgi:hypothetical protein
VESREAHIRAADAARSLQTVLREHDLEGDALRAVRRLDSHLASVAALRGAAASDAHTTTLEETLAVVLAVRATSGLRFARPVRAALEELTRAVGALSTERPRSPARPAKDVTPRRVRRRRT